MEERRVKFTTGSIAACLASIERNSEHVSTDHLIDLKRIYEELASLQDVIACGPNSTGPGKNWRPLDERPLYKRKYSKFILIVNEAKKVFESSASWEFKYRLISDFNLKAAAAEAGLILDYYDPDTTYEEDLKALMRALDELTVNLGDLI